MHNSTSQCCTSNPKALERFSAGVCGFVLLYLYSSFSQNCLLPIWLTHTQHHHLLCTVHLEGQLLFETKQRLSALAQTSDSLPRYFSLQLWPSAGFTVLVKFKACWFSGLGLYTHLVPERVEAADWRMCLGLFIVKLVTIHLHTHINTWNRSRTVIIAHRLYWVINFS